jgi:hypothetical protein
MARLASGYRFGPLLTVHQGTTQIGPVADIVDVKVVESILGRQSSDRS